MDPKQKYEDIALKKSILPVLFYLIVCAVLFFAIDQVSMKTNGFLGVDNVKVIQILKIIVIGFITTFLIFWLVYKYKFVSVNASLNSFSVVNSSPYAEFVVRVKDYSIQACSPVMNRLLGYSSNEIKAIALRDILTESAFKLLQDANENKQYINRDFSDLHFVDKSRGLLSFAANVMRLEMLDKEYILVRLHAHKIAGSSVDEEMDTSKKETKRNFQF